MGVASVAAASSEPASKTRRAFSIKELFTTDQGMIKRHRGLEGRSKGYHTTLYYIQIVPGVSRASPGARPAAFSGEGARFEPRRPFRLLIQVLYICGCNRSRAAGNAVTPAAGGCCAGCPATCHVREYRQCGSRQFGELCGLFSPELALTRSESSYACSQMIWSGAGAG